MKHDVNLISIDLAKNTFHLIGVNHTGKLLLKKCLKRNQLPPFISQHPQTTIAMEACTGAHH